MMMNKESLIYIAETYFFLGGRQIFQNLQFFSTTLIHAAQFILKQTYLFQLCYGFSIGLVPRLWQYKMDSLLMVWFAMS